VRPVVRSEDPSRNPDRTAPVSGNGVLLKCGISSADALCKRTRSLGAWIMPAPGPRSVRSGCVCLRGFFRRHGLQASGTCPGLFGPFFRVGHTGRGPRGLPSTGMRSTFSRFGVSQDVCSWRQRTCGVLWRLVCCLYTPPPASAWRSGCPPAPHGLWRQLAWRWSGVLSVARCR